MEEHLQAVRDCESKIIDQFFTFRRRFTSNQARALLVLIKSGIWEQDIINWKNDDSASEVPEQFRKQVEAIREMQDDTIHRVFRFRGKVPLRVFKALWALAENNYFLGDIKELLNTSTKGKILPAGVRSLLTPKSSC